MGCPELPVDYFFRKGGRPASPKRACTAIFDCLAVAADGKLSTRTWSRGVVTSYAYNAAGDLTGISYSDSTPAVTLSYNRLGQKTSVTDAVGSRSFAYNSTFDLTSEAISGLYSKTISRAYDSLGRASGLSIGSEYNVGYSYDSVGRFASLTNGSDAFTCSYLANSNLVSSITYPNGIMATNTYEASRELITLTENKFGVIIVSKYNYTHDATGRRTTMGKNGTAFAQSDSIAYGYNSRSEVTSAAATNETAYNYGYSFDNIGNRVTANERGTTFNYASNALNQYTAINSANPAYDLDGSMTANVNGWTYTWDAENRLKSATNGSQVLNFKYDYMSRRVEKNVLSGETVSKDEKYVYDNYKQIARVDATNSNALVQKFVWNNERLLSVIDAPSSTSYYAVQDANKNITELLDGSGNIAAHYEYSPFGKVTVQNGAYASSNPYRFSSEYADDETGLVYYNYRYYESGLGRWLSRDPIEERGGFCVYSFLANNPQGAVDITGNYGLAELGQTFRDTGKSIGNTIITLPSIVSNKAKKIWINFKYWWFYGDYDAFANRLNGGTKYSDPCSTSEASISNGSGESFENYSFTRTHVKAAAQTVLNATNSGLSGAFEGDSDETLATPYYARSNLPTNKKRSPIVKNNENANTTDGINMAAGFIQGLKSDTIGVRINLTCKCWDAIINYAEGGRGDHNSAKNMLRGWYLELGKTPPF